MLVIIINVFFFDAVGGFATGVAHNRARDEAEQDGMQSTSLDLVDVTAPSGGCCG